MSYRPYKLIGIAVAFALLALAAAGSVYLRRTRAADADERQGRLAEQVREEAERAVQEQLSALEAKAREAGSLPVLCAQVGMVDWNTLRDGFTSEAWWEPVRRSASVYGVALGDKLDGVEGAPAELDASDLIARARAHQHGAGVRAVGGAAFLLATAVINKPGPKEQPVLLIGKPFGEEAVAALAQQLKAAVVMTNGKAVLASAGSARAKRSLEAAATKGPTGAGEAASSQSTQFGGGVLLWTAPETSPSAADSTLFNAIFGAAGVLAALALGLGFLLRRTRPEPQLADRVGATQVISAPRAPIGEGQGTQVKPGLANGSGKASAKAKGAAGPQEFGRYTLLDRLGEGGMAEVYTAVVHGAEGFKRHFVVKRLRGEMLGRKDLVDMFIDEARLASTLVHSNIIPVFDFGKVGAEYFMAQEYILGRDLGRITKRARLVDGQGVDPKLVLYAIRETLQALEYAHTRVDGEGNPMGIVHRDVSPQNILISARGEVKLLDFGIAKARERLTHTVAGTVKGNVRFMAPEQAHGLEVDARTDVASVALVMYSALAGAPLYEGATAHARLIKAAGGVGDEEAARIARLPAPLQPLLIKALQQDPALRFQSAAEFADAITALGDQVGNLAAMHREMERLFGDELRAEQAKLQAHARVIKAASAGAPREGTAQTELIPQRPRERSR